MRKLFTFQDCKKLLVTLALICVTQMVNANSPLPDLGSPDLVIYDQSTEQRLGDAFQASLHRDFKVSQNVILNQYIRDLGHKLASFAETSRPFRFYVIDNPSINAFAGPNGIIGIHTGLINASQSEAELAAVIAHEISHVTQNHLSRRFEYASTAGNINSIATILAAILIGSVDPNAGMATLMGGMGYNLQQQLRNSRIHETEADAIGINLLHKAGYDPHAMGAFFKRLSQNERLNTFSIPEILRTHPVSDSRLAEAENRASQLDKQAIVDNSEDFRLIKILIAENTNTHIVAKPNIDRKEVCLRTTIKDNIVTDCLMQILASEEHSLIYLSQALQLANSQPKVSKQSIDFLTKKGLIYLDLYPKNVDLLFNYALLLAKHQNTTTAINLLEARVSHLDYQYQILKKLSELYAQQEKMGYAYLYLSQYYIKIGHKKRSEYYLEQATAQIKNSDKTLEKKIKKYQQEHHKSLIVNDINK